MTTLATWDSRRPRRSTRGGRGRRGRERGEGIPLLVFGPPAEGAAGCCRGDGEAGSANPFFGWLLNEGQFDYRCGGKVLEIGAGGRRLCAGSTTLDCNPARNPDVVSCIERMPFADKEFDLVIANEVFCTHDEATQRRMLAEIERVGRACLLRQWKFCLHPGCGFKFDAQGNPQEPVNGWTTLAPVMFAGAVAAIVAGALYFGTRGKDG